MKKHLAGLAAIADKDIDTTDIPEAGEEFFKKAKLIIPRRSTCQICGREIKTNTRLSRRSGNVDLIAHHGYKRPYNAHVQTRSCFGARYRPYEEAHDALDAYILKLELWLAQAETAAHIWLTEPPETITFQRRNAWGKLVGNPVIYQRPATFDAKLHFNAGSYRPNTYEGCYTAIACDLRHNVTGLAQDLKAIRGGREAWKP